MPHSKLETGKNGKHLWILHHKERGEHGVFYNFSALSVFSAVKLTTKNAESTKELKNFVLSAFLWWCGCQKPRRMMSLAREIRPVSSVAR